VQALRLDLQAAEVRLEARRGGAPVDAGLWEVHLLAADGSRTEVAGSGAAVLETTLPAGRYAARAFVGDLWHEAAFEVRAGGQARVVVPVR
jgi:hypothetical protein